MSEEIEKDLKNKEIEMKLKEQEALEFYHFLKSQDCILFETIVGSQAYGTNTASSDIDKKFVYILPLDNILGNKYIEQLNVNKDYTGWEIRRFLELIQSNNPTCLELLASPEDCIVSKHRLFDEILNRKNEFITKTCKDSFGGYARQQINKARGLDKKQNWEKAKITRKDILDFCYVIDGEKSTPWKAWNSSIGFEEKFCGVVNVPNARDVYAVYFDENACLSFSELIPETERELNKKRIKSSGKPMGFGYKGIVKSGEGLNSAESNQLRLSSIPKGETPICNITYNKDGYTASCKDYKEYQEWILNRNEARYVETKGHGQKIDGKNMMHCMRLIRMAQEIGSGQGIVVRRPDAQELLSIRRGEVDLGELMIMANEAINKMDKIFKNSKLPKNIDPELINNLLIKIRREFYNI